MTDTAANLRVIDTFMVTCDDCGGEGGEEVSFAGRGPPWDDGADGGEWIECPTCHGSGWLADDKPAPGIDQDELSPPTDGDDRC